MDEEQKWFIEVRPGGEPMSPHRFWWTGGMGRLCPTYTSMVDAAQWSMDEATATHHLDTLREQYGAGCPEVADLAVTPGGQLREEMKNLPERDGAGL